MMKNKIFHNAEWILVCKIVQALIQFVVGVLTARYLGPANYGLINYAASVVAFFTPLMELGLRNTLVQEYVTSPKREGEIMCTSLLLNLVSAVACMVGATAFVAVANPNDGMTLWVCTLYSLTLLTQAFEMLQFWFQAKLISKYSSLAMLGAHAVMSAYKIYLLASGKNVMWFALSHAVEYGVAGILLLWAYKRKGQYKLQFSLPLAKEMLRKSRYYIIASLLVVLYARVANLILMQQYGEVETGYYAAASTCTCIAGFVFDAIIDTARPVVLSSQSRSMEAFEQNVSRVYAIISWLAIAQGVAFTIFAELIVRMLYGDDFLPAVPVMQILGWSWVFSRMGTVRDIWILGTNNHRFLWIINLSGAIASILINLLFVPLWGACGAAIACVLAQLFTNVIMGYIIKEIRPNNRLLLKGMNPKLLIDLIGQFLKTFRQREN